MYLAKGIGGQTHVSAGWQAGEDLHERLPALVGEAAAGKGQDLESPSLHGAAEDGRPARAAHGVQVQDKRLQGRSLGQGLPKEFRSLGPWGLYIYIYR